MPRYPRSYIQTSYFHVIVQGINKNYIFVNQEDILYYIKTLYKICGDYSIKIIAYCIMNNHAHILIKTEFIKNLSKLMHRVNTNYGLYFNKKYNRVRYVFRDRYKSEGIYSEEHLYNCIKYIYDNPVKAGLCSKPEDYKYSNYKKNDKIFLENSSYVFLDVDTNKKDICEKIINEFLLEYNITIKNLKDNNKILRKLVIILKNDYNISLRYIAKELNISREKIRYLYKY